MSFCNQHWHGPVRVILVYVCTVRDKVDVCRIRNQQLCHLVLVRQVRVARRPDDYGDK
jgi:hypothetical protein